MCLAKKRGGCCRNRIFRRGRRASRCGCLGEWKPNRRSLHIYELLLLCSNCVFEVPDACVLCQAFLIEFLREDSLFINILGVRVRFSFGFGRRIRKFNRRARAVTTRLTQRMFIVEALAAKTFAISFRKLSLALLIW